MVSIYLHNRRIFYLGNGNIALHQDTSLLFGTIFLLPSYLLVDGLTEQPSCIDFASHPDDRKFDFYVTFESPRNITDITLHFHPVDQGM
jgi:hypothetical protein